jgi:hypothetical protein
MRALLGVLGATAFGAGIVTCVAELRQFRGGFAVVPTLVAVFCAVIAAGGVVLLRGAVRGRITVRRPGHRAPIL